MNKKYSGPIAAAVIIIAAVIGAFNYIPGTIEPNTLAPESAETEDNLEEVTLLKIVDGDTLRLSIDGEEKKVRLIGINTPESVAADESRNNEYGVMACDHMKALLEGVDTLYIEYDEEPLDQYGRTLAYIWLKNTTDSPEENMLNAIMIKDGYAIDVVYEPNVKYKNYFFKLKKEAMDNSVGLWQYEGFRALWKN